jgi:hypothetical protein
MKISYFTRLALCIMALLLAQPGYARQANEAASQNLSLPDEVFRSRFEQSENLPDHLAYLSLMQSLYNAEITTGHAQNIARIRSHINVSEETAEHFLQQALSSYNDMLMDNRNTTENLLCHGEQNLTAADNSQSYATLDILDDLKESHASDQYQKMMQTFDNNVGQELQSWLAVIKTDSSHYKYNHRAVFEHTAQSVGLVIDTACHFLANNSL